ncbi:MAG: hypothetical protein R3D85_09320 [Paracoccaceae bacterium]
MSQPVPKPAALAAALALAGVLAGCAADPLADVPRLSDVALSEPAPVVEAVAAPEETSDKTGFFQRLMRKREVAPPSAEPATDATPDDKTGEAVAEAPDARPAPDPAPAHEATATPAAPAAPERRGLFGLFGKRPPDAAAETGALAESAVATPADIAAPEPAALPRPEALETPETPTAKSAEAARPGLFSRRTAAAAPRPRHGGPALRDAAPGEVLPFGVVARACHMKRGEMGKEVAKYPERGAKYRVYDSAPGNLGLHSFYLTGFGDGCPRQVTAALAVFGTPGMYEALRYGLPAKARSKKPTDKAYETVKSRLCGVSRSQPCGTRIDRLEKHTVFLSLYDRFEDARGWTNLLLSEGEVIAADHDG